MTESWRKRLLAGSFLLQLFFMAVPEARSEKWQFIGFTKYRDPLYVDLDRTAPKGDILSAWMRITLAEHSLFRGQVTQDLQRVGKSAQLVKYLEMNKEIDCRNSRIRHGKLTYYDYQDRILASTGNPKALWKPIVAGSLWPGLQKAVCTQKKTK